MRPLRYSINVTLDGCCHHEAGLPPDEESMRYWTAEMERADALLFGRVTYEMMESAWRKPATGTWPDWMNEWEVPFAETIDRAKKYIVSSTLSGVDWNAELVRGDLGQAVQRLKQEPGEGLWVGGVTLPLALADLGLIDEYEFLVQPVLAGPATLLAGLRERIRSSSWIAMSSGRERSPCDTGPPEFRLDVICPARWPLPRDGTTTRARARAGRAPERADISTGDIAPRCRSLGPTVPRRAAGNPGVTGHLREGGDNVPVKLIRPDGSTRRRQSPERDPATRRSDLQKQDATHRVAVRGHSATLAQRGLLSRSWYFVPFCQDARHRRFLKEERCGASLALLWSRWVPPYWPARMRRCGLPLGTSGVRRTGRCTGRRDGREHPYEWSAGLYEIYTLRDAVPGTYQVILNVFPTSLDCTGAALAIPTARLDTNARGNGQADVKFTPEDVAGFRGMTFSLSWTVTGPATYVTGCTVVVLD